MYPLGADLIALVGMVVCLRASLRTGLATLIIVAFVIPTKLPVAHLAGFDYVPVQRLVLLAMATRLVVMGVRRQLPPGLFDPTPVHAVFALFLTVALVLGVATAAPNTSTSGAVQGWVTYATDFLFFIVVLALIRTLDDESWPFRVLLVVFAVLAVIALAERFIGSDWNAFLYGSASQGVIEATKLPTRGGAVRARAASEFPLAMAWLFVGGVIATVVAGLRFRRPWLTVVLIGLLAAGAYATTTRSVIVPAAVALVLFPILARRPKLLIATVVGIAVVGGAYLLAPSFGQNFTASADQGSINIRFDRIPPLLAALTKHAYTGLGIGGLDAIGLPSTDATYLLIYGSLGVIGVAILLGLQMTTLAVVCRGILATDPVRRETAAAAALGVAAMTAAGFAFDAVALAQAQELLWIFAAVGIVAAERALGPPRWLAVPGPARVASVGAAVGAGFLAAAMAPTSVAETITFVSIPQRVALSENASYAGFLYTNSVCDVISAGRNPASSTQATCTTFDEGPIEGQIRIEAPDRAQASAQLDAIAAQIATSRFLRGFQLADVPDPSVSKPTALRTAPVWLPILIGMAVILIPDERSRRRRDAPAAEETGRPAEPAQV